MATSRLEFRILGPLAVRVDDTPVPIGGPKQRALLALLLLAAVEERIDAEPAFGRQLALVSELEALGAEHPYRERFRAQLMLALYRCGRQAEGLDVYRRTRTLLNEELGLEPGVE